MARRSTFKIIWWKWYLVDLRNWHHPVIVRKDFDNKPQAQKFKKEYCDKNFDVIRGKEALALKVYDWHNYKPKHRHSQVRKSKYDFPPHVKTQKQKEIFRKNQRRSMKADKNKPKITDAALFEILQDKPMLFYKRLSRLRNYYQAYSKPVRGLYTFIRYYKWPVHVVKLSAIVITLEKYYDTAQYDPIDLAMYIYEGWPERVNKRLTGGSTADKEKDEVVKEFKARGFIKYANSGFDEECNYVSSIGMKPQLVYKDLAWHEYSQMELYDHYIYNLHQWVGIPGYTKANVAGLDKRA